MKNEASFSKKNFVFWWGLRPRPNLPRPWVGPIWDFCGFQVLYGYMCMLVFYDTVQPCSVILRKISLSMSQAFTKGEREAEREEKLKGLNNVQGLNGV